MSLNYLLIAVTLMENTPLKFLRSVICTHGGNYSGIVTGVLKIKLTLSITLYGFIFTLQHEPKQAKCQFADLYQTDAIINIHCDLCEPLSWPGPIPWQFLNWSGN